MVGGAWVGAGVDGGEVGVTAPVEDAPTVVPVVTEAEVGETVVDDDPADDE